MAVKDYESETMIWLNGFGYKLLVIPGACDENIELGRMISYIRKEKISIVVIDHHDLEGHYVEKLRGEGCITVVIDDEGKRVFTSDIVVNYNIHASDLNFNCDSRTRLLLGPSYAILRSQFRHPPNGLGKKHGLLVTLGGGYARGEVNKVMKTFEKIGGKRLGELSPVIVLGPMFPRPESFIKHYAHLPVSYRFNVSHMREIMEKASIAVSAGGGTLYELSRMGIPSIIIVLDENQTRTASCFEEKGISINLGWYEQVSIDDICNALEMMSPDQVYARSRKAIALVDGKGAERVVEHILSAVPF